MTRHPLGGLRLTDTALQAIGHQPSRSVPLLVLPWRDEAADRTETSDG